MRLRSGLQRVPFWIGELEDGSKPCPRVYIYCLSIYVQALCSFETSDGVPSARVSHMPEALHPWLNSAHQRVLEM
jgi:hypothetical protein